MADFHPGKPEYIPIAPEGQYANSISFRQVFQRTDAKVKCFCALNLHRKNTNKINFSKHLIVIILNYHVTKIIYCRAVYLHR